MVDSGGRTIVVGVDGSLGGREAMMLAARLAQDLAADVVVAYGTLSSPEPRKSPDDVEAWCLPLRELGLRYRTVVEPDDAVPLIGAVAEREDAYLVVVGATSRSELAEFVFGGVALELAHHGGRPLAVAVPPGPR